MNNSMTPEEYLEKFQQKLNDMDACFLSSWPKEVEQAYANADFLKQYSDFEVTLGKLDITNGGKTPGTIKFIK